MRKSIKILKQSYKVKDKLDIAHSMSAAKTIKWDVNSISGPLLNFYWLGDHNTEIRFYIKMFTEI